MRLSPLHTPPLLPLSKLYVLKGNNVDTVLMQHVMAKKKIYSNAHNHDGDAALLADKS